MQKEEELERRTRNPNSNSGELEVEVESIASPSTPTPTWLDLDMDMELPLPEGFRLEKAVCSHGLFMMAPNHWDPLSNTLTRPLRLHNDNDSGPSLLVSISHSSLSVRVRSSLSPHQRRALLAQVSRMLRLSEADDKAIREFRSMPLDHQNRSFAGRVFRSPTLFEDMVKCILLCNCTWPRTLSMARALCELQLELQNGSPLAVETEGFIPKTPAAKETCRKGGNSSAVSTKGMLLNKKLELEVGANLQMDHVLASSSDDSFPDGREYFKYTGNFPSPNELAHLKESFLAKRCKLGYRAGRIIKLARAIVEGKIQLRQLEELSKGASLPSYKQLWDQLKQIEGFGPFTIANVLMCMGYYHVIPTDSETIRHLKQVHSRNSTSQTIGRDVEEIYGKYKPYQFLAYWSEIWDFYERRFGKMSELQPSDYKLMTAANMRSAGKQQKRKRPSRKRQC